MSMTKAIYIIFESRLSVFAISSETARRTAAKLCMQTRAICVTYGLGLMSIGVIVGKKMKIL